MKKLPALLRTAVATVAVAGSFAGTTLHAVASARTASVVDGVRVTVSGRYVRGMVLSGAPGDATQETTIVDRLHHRTLSIIAVPFGTRPGTEDVLPPARRGGAGDYRAILHDFRVRTGEFASEAPAVSLFGSRTGGDLSQRHESLADASGRHLERDVFAAEWVTEAGPRLWIVRVMQFVAADHPLGAVADFALSLEGLAVWSDASLHAPTTVFADVASPAAPAQTPAVDTADAKRPPAYSDPCDAENYDRATGRSDWRHELGASYRGVPACGPRPATGGVPIAAGFSPAAPLGVVQFDATELSMRWMYLAFGTPPFTGNGDELLLGYDPGSGGQPLFKYANVAHSGVHPMPGDVLSYETGGTGGHTSVVQSVHADAHGNGWIGVVEQDASASGFARLPMLDDEVFSNDGGPILGWLSPRAP